MGVTRPITATPAAPRGRVDGASAGSRHSVRRWWRRHSGTLLDLGRHILAKGFAVSATEYKEIASRLGDAGVLDAALAATLTRLAGYRNRLVHFYDETSERELHDICSTQLGDVDRLANAVAAWAERHPERLDRRP